MKVLHTSDWHLGQMFYDYDRQEEQTDYLRQIVGIIKDEKPDAMVVSGDVFHTSNPSSAAIEMYNDALVSMHEACPTMKIVVTSGNHDSASRLVMNNPIWSRLHVDIIGHIARKNDENRTPDFDSQIREVHSADGDCIGYIAAIPHCYDSNYPTVNAELVREERAEAYFSGLSERVKEINTKKLPVVLMAHLAVTGSDLAGHDNVGGMESKDASIFSNCFDYVALGHIHKPQDITDHARYCGAPIPVNFGENFEHSVSIVTVEAGKTPVIKTKVINNLIPLIDFPTPLPHADAIEDELNEDERPLPFNDALEKLRELNPDKKCYIRFVVKVDETLSPLSETFIAETIKDKKCRVCRIMPFSFRDNNKKDADNVITKMKGADLKDKSPLEIVELFFKMKGLDLSEEQKSMVSDATRIAEQNKK